MHAGKIDQTTTFFQTRNPIRKLITKIAKKNIILGNSVKSMLRIAPKNTDAKSLI
jgi:hypothetical protein